MVFAELPIWSLWIGSGVFLIIIEIFAPGLIVGLIGASCIATGITALFVNDLTIQLVVFSVATLIFFIFIRPILKKKF